MAEKKKKTTDKELKQKTKSKKGAKAEAAEVAVEAVAASKVMLMVRKKHQK